MPSAKTKTAITKALIALAAERDWEDVTLEGIAERADVTLAVLRGAYNSRLEILADLSRHVDGEVLAERDPDLADEAPREDCGHVEEGVDNARTKLDALGQCGDVG